MEEDEVQALIVRFIGDNKDFLKILNSSLEATRTATQAIQREAEKIAKTSADASARAAARTSDAAKEEARRAKVMAEGAKVTDKNLTSTERYNKELNRLQGLLNEGAISGETFYRAQNKLYSSMTSKDKVMAEGQKVLRSVMTDQEKYERRVARLGNLLTEGAISTETYDRAVAAANTTKNKVMAEGHKITEDLMTSEERRKATVGNLNGLLVNGAITQETFNRGVTRANQEHKDATSSLNKVTNSMHFYVSALLSGVAAHEAWKVAKRSLFLGAESESMKTTFGVLLKNEARGIEMIKNIQIIAQTTALTSDSLQHGAQTLLQLGVAVNKIIPTLMQIGDIAGGDVERIKHLTLAFGQMTQAGRLMGQDLIQMVNAGFNPLKEIARTSILHGGRTKDQVLGDLKTANGEQALKLLTELDKASGKTVSELRTDMENGLITVEMVTKAYKSATEEGGSFFEMLKKQAKEAKGMWANMKDDIDAALRTIGEVMINELNLKGGIQAISDGAKSLTNWIKTLTPVTKTLLIILGAIVLAITMLGISLIIGSFAMKTAYLAWSIGSEVLTVLIGRLTAANIAAGGFKLALIALAFYGAKAFYDLAVGTEKAKKDMEHMVKQADQIKNNLKAMTDKDVKRIMGLPNVDEQLKEAERLLKFINQPKDVKTGEFLSNQSIGFWEESWKKAVDRVETIKRAGLTTSLKDLGLADKYPAGFSKADALKSEESYMNFVKANLDAIKIRKGELEELLDTLKETSRATGQLAVKLKDVENELKDTTNFAGMDKWEKQVMELRVLMEKLNTNPTVRRNTINEVEIIQKLAKVRELEGEADDYRRKMRQEKMDFGKTPEEAKYDHFRDKGLEEFALARVRNAQRLFLIYKEEGRIRDEARKLNEEFKEPIDVYRKEAEDLKEMLNKGFINERVFNKGMDAALNKFNELTGAAHALKDALQGIQASAFSSAEALGKMNEFKERMKMKPPVSSTDLNFDPAQRLPEWLKKIDPLSQPPKVILPLAPMPHTKWDPNIPAVDDPRNPIGMERRNDLMAPIGGNVQAADQDRKDMLRLMQRVAESNESMEKKPPVILKSANL